MNMPIKIEALPESVLPLKDWSTFGSTTSMGSNNGQAGSNRVYMSGSVYNGLHEPGVFPTDRECGGFLLGEPFRQVRLDGQAGDGSGYSWGVSLSHLVPAEATLADAAHFVLTAETWSHITCFRHLHFPGLALVGWYHTHVLAKNNHLLSNLDLRLHHQFFGRPWQIALLVSMRSADHRDIRCFQWNEHKNLVECAYEVPRIRPN